MSAFDPKRTFRISLSVAYQHLVRLLKPTVCATESKSSTDGVQPAFRPPFETTAPTLMVGISCRLGPGETSSCASDEGDDHGSIRHYASPTAGSRHGGIFGDRDPADCKVCGERAPSVHSRRAGRGYVY